MGRAGLSSISKQIIWNKNVSAQLKKVIFSAMNRSRLLYRGEAWWSGKQLMGKLETVQNNFVRYISGHTMKDKLYMHELIQELRMSSIEDELCSRRLYWLGHVIRMDACRLVSRGWGSKLEGKKGRGRPRWSYEMQEREDLAI